MLTLKTANILREYKTPKGSLLVLSSLDRESEKNVGALGENISRDHLATAAGEIYTLSFADETISFMGRGGGKLYLIRDGAFVCLAETNEAEVFSLSGPAKPNDIYVLGKKEFFERSGENEIKTNLIAKTFDNLRGDDVVFAEISDIKPIPKINFSGMFAKVKNILKKAVPERKLYVRQTSINEEDSQSKKITMSVGLILIVILIASIGFGINAKKQKEIRSRYEGKLAEAVKNLEEARSLAGASPDRARELFVASEQVLTEIEGLKVKDSEVSALREKINTEREQILGEFRSPSSIFLDLSLLSSGFKGDEIAASGGTLYVLDKGGKKVVSVDIESKKSKVAANSDTLENPQKIAPYEDRLFVLEDDGIYEAGGSRKKVIEKEWDGEVLINAFAGNLYVLSREKGEIYRFQGSGSTFGAKQNWLAGGTAPDFSNAKSWTMDGAIYVLSDNSKVLKFSQGSPQNFSQTATNTINDFYADEENESVYALNKSAKKIVVLDKKGSYKAAYIDDKIGEAEKIVVSEKDKKIIILTTDKLYSIEMKHI